MDLTRFIASKDPTLNGETWIMSELSERLKKARLHLGMTQDEFADAIGAKKRGYQDNESGKTIPRSDVIQGMVNLGFNANWLLCGDGPMLVPDDEFFKEQQKDMVSALFDNDVDAERRRDERAIARVNEIIEFNNLMMKGLSHLDEDRAKLWNAVLSDLVQRQIVTKEDILALLNITKN